MTAEDIPTLGPGAEFDRIRAIAARLGPRARDIGDDCALVSVGGVPLAVSADLAVEGTHFLREWLTPEEIGWRASAAALSDVAAVAGAPEGVLASVGVPADLPEAFLSALMGGVGEAANAVGAEVWGGDLVRAPVITIDIAVIGHAPEPVRRSGARPGDGLWVTGRLGGPAAAIRAWRAGAPPDPAARARFARPEPRVAAAAWLRDHGAHAMIDVSDGIASDAAQLSAASQVSIVVAAEHIPVFPSATEIEALVGGEEYELLVAIPAEVDVAVEDFERRFSIPLTHIGAIEAGAGVRIERNGATVEPPQGFIHF